MTKKAIKMKMTKWLYVIGCFIIIVIGMVNISRNTSLRIVGDEFGYWTAGATFAGLDWSSVASYNNYYGFGYGLILAPLIKLGIAQTVKYQIAIVLNVLMLACAFILFFRLMEKKGAEPATAAMIALVGTLYSSNVVYSQFTFSEVFTLFLYLLSACVIYSFFDTSKTIDALILPFLLGLLFATHMRNVGVVIINVLFFCGIAIKKKKLSALLIFVLLGIAAAAIVFFLKAWYQQIIHSYSDVNEVSGQLKKISTLFTIKGIGLFLVGFIGKTTYSVLATFSIVGVALMRTIGNLFADIKEKKLRTVTILGIYLFANLLVMEAISAFFLMDYTGRYDLLTYGRYHDFTVCSIIVYELYMSLIRKERPKLSLIGLSAVLSVFFTILTIHFLPDLPLTGHTSVFSPGVALAYLRGNHLVLLLLANLFVLALYYLLLNSESVVSRFSNVTRVGAFSAVLLVFFLVMAAAPLWKTYSWAVEGCRNEERLAREILDDPTIEGLWYYAPDSPIDIDFMQFLLNEKSIICFDDTQVLAEMNENDRILTTSRSRLLTDQWTKRYELLGSSSYLKLWKKSMIEWNSDGDFDINDIRERNEPFSGPIEGITEPEENGTIWAGGTISLSLNKPYNHVFSLRGFVPNYPEEETKGLTVKICVNSVLVIEAYTPCGESFELCMDCNNYKDLLAGYVLDDMITLSIEPDYSFVPADYGSADQRTLSFVITEMSWKGED